MLVTTSCFSPLHIFIARMNSNDYKVPPVLSDEEYYDLLDEIGGYMPFGLRAYHFVCTNQLLQNPIMAGYPNCALPIRELFGTRPQQPMRLRVKSQSKSFPVIRKWGIYVLCSGDLGDRFYMIDGQNVQIITELHVTPISLREAQLYIEANHRHCGPPKFHKFSLSLTVPGENEPVGVAVASTPKARALADGKTLEINRVCCNSHYGNAYSKLYAHAIRAGREMGYCRFISYTLPSESGSSLKAAGFRMDGLTTDSKTGWNSLSRPRDTTRYPFGRKVRWILEMS